MNYSYSGLYTLELPPDHRFPMEKYRRTRDLLLAEGTLRREQIGEPEPCPRETLELVHQADYLDRVLEGKLSRDELRRIGFPWSEALVRRSRTSVAGTIAAAREALLRGAGGNFAGGTHHAHTGRGEGFCIFNDVAVAIRKLRAEGAVRRAAVIDCDVHQGNGTAAIFRGDPDVFTFSMHGRNNWPFLKETSTLDIALEDGTGDGLYLELLEEALERIFTGFRPEVAFYVAGVDPLATDRLGRLALTHRGLRERDRLVLSRARAAGVGVAICFGGGYAEPLEDIVEAHANTFRVAEALFPG